ncbi:MAG TPA: hypothetical protein VN851_21220 [Thermoanaerobaculia bacterium]|nr:hypothetical protein [Thermoanaerobaculia bacterium]
MSASFASPAADRPKSERLRLAIEVFFARTTRRGHPEGEWRDGLWYPSREERQACCVGIEPTLQNRQALESHCRTQAHVAALYDVAVGELKAAVRDDRKQGSPIAQRVASTFVGPPSRSTETFAELRQKGRDEAFEKLRAVLAQGLPLFERLRTFPESEDPNAMEPLLETASESAERLLATINSARRQEAFMACAGAFLETLKTTLEQPKGKKRRAEPSGKEVQA